MNPKINCLIADDERLALRLMESHISKIPQLNLIACCEDAISAMQVLREHKIDLMFLDIQMPNLTGMEMLRSLQNPPLAIMITAFPDYALEGFELHVVDYLVKPVSFERLMQGVEKAFDRLQVQAKSNTEAERDYFYVKADYKLVKLAYADIRYIEGLAQYVKIHTTQKTYVVHKTLKAMEQILPSSEFFRVHRSYIIPLDQISAIYGNTIEIGTNEIPIGKSYREAFWQKIEAL